MKLQFLGATRQVTGSRYYLQTPATQFLIDCGMFQEHQFLDRNWQAGPPAASDLQAVVLTHAHLDHCGLLPRLVDQGFRGPIHTTPATAELTEIVLRDSAEIQAEDVKFKSQRHQEEGRTPEHAEVPLYTSDDVDRTLPLVKPAAYGQSIAVGPDVQATLHDAGHILGSAMVDLKIGADAARRRIVFSGDIGQWNRPILRDPSLLDEADYVIMESTYGDRSHQEPGDPHGGIEDQLAEVVAQTTARGGNVVIPVFAIDRGQELMYYFRQLLATKRMRPLDIFLDSPMAEKVMEVFLRHSECFDDETRQMVAAGQSPLQVPRMKMIRTTEESKALNNRREPAIIMATSGMCTGGRIKHHLRHNITRPESTILFVGYQSDGTLGRQILRGDREVRIHGRMWPVRAQIRQIHGFSGHADRDALLRWIEHIRQPRCVFITHGEAEASQSLAAEIRRRKGWTVVVPEYRQTVELE